MWLERDLRYDPWIILAVASLTGIGIVMIYSTSSITAGHLYHGKSTFFLNRQLVSAGIGFMCMVAAMHVNYERLKLFAWPLLILSLVLVVLVLVPGVGKQINGSRRWLRPAGFSFQPSELARLALIIFLAYSVPRKGPRIKSFTYGLAPYLVVWGIFIGLIFIEPDMGGAITLGIIMLVMLFVAGTRISYLMGIAAAAAPVIFYFMASAEYRWRRVMATINPWDYWHDAGWQLVQSLLAFGSGGLFGVGLGEGRQKLFYLPDAHTDFILSVIGEELGFIGVMAVIGAFLAFGITTMIVAPAIINMMVVMGLLPTKGLVLPFVSYGGSSLVINMTAAGILLNISAKMFRTR